MNYPELKAGYIVKFDDEKISMVTYGSGGDLCVSGEHWFPVDEFDKQLCYGGHRIVEIYGFASNMRAYELNIADRKCIWKYLEPKKISKKQLEKILGYSIEIVED